MPSVTESMYCAEQICIPPSFPYLLRQYAKAAIRSQPTDLLKWSTAYFRCISLNVPPPVKPRLEYPVPQDFYGITPGWLKALIYQLQNNPTVSFKILWDRWMGACLQHNTLIQLLCLGGFEDPYAINWLKFIAICAATLTDDLTHTMILICEILTEEPEGGSAMITLETFTVLYEFLAKIDASHGQNLRNYFFRDSLLSLWREKISKEEMKEIEKVESIVELEESVITKTSTESVEEERVSDVERVVSCPSLPEDDQYSIEYLLRQQQIIHIAEEEFESEEEEEFAGFKHRELEDQIVFPDIEEEEIRQDETEKTKDVDLAVTENDEDEEIKFQDKEAELEETEQAIKKDEEQAEGAVEEADEIEKKQDENIVSQVEPQEAEETIEQIESADTIINQPVRDLDHIFDDDFRLREDLERLRKLQQELAGETDEELEKFKCRLIAEMPLSSSQEEGIKHFQLSQTVEQTGNIEKDKTEDVEGSKSGETSSDPQENEQTDKNKAPYDDIYVEAIRGIGVCLPDSIIQTVIEYMKNCAKVQHGMVMPRNIRHYSCPPLEILDY
ncbi:hypothetical protein ABEB36_006455 [Hypothenemus hampei]|uniref:Uncharacterized protein n=1 Tax=Hypothenemus hampei TaxID=57062 RepID=A0ABD1ERA9_HYPHA